ncbi:MAG: permease prefix domain 1-containing protein [Planctomycetota bacterium]
MLEIDQAMIQWRSDWRARVPSMNEEVLDEMECHLRDSILLKLRDGIDSTTAIEEAMAEFGSTTELVDEFEQVPLETVPWWPVKPVRTLLLCVGLAAIVLITQAPHDGNSSLLIRGHVGLVAFGYAAAAGVGILSLLFLGCRLVSDPLPGQKRTFCGSSQLLCRIAAIALLVGVALGVVLLFASGSAYAWMTSRNGAVIIVLGWALFMSTRFRVEQIRDVHLSSLAGLAANITVVYGCYGPVMAHPASVVGMAIMLTILISHAVMALSAFAPANCLSEWMD